MTTAGPVASQSWEERVEEVRLLTDGMLATVEEMPGPDGSAAARDRWERFSRAVALEAARAWAVPARYGFQPPEAEGLDWGRRGAEERFVRSHGPYTRGELRVLARAAFADLVAWMEGLGPEERRRVDRRTGLGQARALGGLAVTFAAKLSVLEDWVRSAGGPRAPWPQAAPSSRARSTSARMSRDVKGFLRKRGASSKPWRVRRSSSAYPEV